MINRIARNGLVLGMLLLGLAFAVSAGAQSGPFAGLPLVGDPAPDPSPRFSFVILGDKTSGGEGKWPIYDRAVDAINLLEPDFVITVGDQIPGHMEERTLWDAEWAEYLEHARRLEMPLVLTPGNHDIANVQCYEFWKQDFGPTYFSFDYKDCHFLVLNTEEERFDGRGPVWEKMMTFAEQDLAAHKDARHTFIFFHKPMWDDPRFLDDWARLERALAGRRYTAVAGHEHYLMTERRNGNLLVVQSATGGGIGLSNVKEFGGFHSFGYVTVTGNNVTYAVVEPEGGVWPVDIAPTAFRKAIAFDLVRLDAEPPDDPLASEVTVRAKARLRNVLSEPIDLELSVEALAASGWQPESASTADGDLRFTHTLNPGGEAEQPLVFRVPRERLPYPPRVTWRLRYRGEWIEADTFPMSQEVTVPIYPADSLRTVSEWHIVGPFPLGPIDTAKLPADPAAANANFFKRFGPEDGFDPDREYEGGLKWRPARSLGRSLLNFNGLMGTLDHALAYALCGVHSPVDQVVHAVVHADNFAQLVLNGELIEEAQSFGTPGGLVYVPLRLEAGWNTLVAKLINNRGDWFIRVLVADPDGNLTFAAAPETSAAPAGAK
jgi:hypothetical protein